MQINGKCACEPRSRNKLKRDGSGSKEMNSHGNGIPLLAWELIALFGGNLVSLSRCWNDQLEQFQKLLVDAGTAEGGRMQGPQQVKSEGTMGVSMIPLPASASLFFGAGFQANFAQQQFHEFPHQFPSRSRHGCQSAASGA